MIEAHDFLYGRHRYVKELGLFERRIHPAEKLRERPAHWESAHRRAFYAAAFCIDGDLGHGRALWHLLRAAEGSAGFHRAALLSPGEEFEAEWLGERHTFRAGVPLHALKGQEFEDGIATAWVLRRPDLATAIAASWDILNYVPWPLSAAGNLFRRALTQVVFGHEDLCREDLADAVEAVDMNSELGPLYLECTLGPQARMVVAYLDRDETAFNAALARSLVGQRKWYSQTDLLLRSPEGYVGWSQLGLCALAHDAGMAVTVESPYIPAWLYRKEWERVPATPV